MGIVLSTFPGKKKDEQVKINSKIQLSTFPKKAEEFKSPSPYGLSGNTTIKPAENRRWGLGWVGDAAQAAYETTKSAFEGLHDSILNAIDTLPSSGVKLSEYEKAPTSTPQARKNYIDSLEKTTPLERVTKMGQVGTATANIAFTPVTAQISAAKKTPILKNIAEPIDYAFQKIGEFGSNTLSAGLDKIPNEILSQKEKDTVRPLIQELGGFTAQAVGIKYGLKVGEKGLKSDKLPLSEKNKANVENGSRIITSAGLTPFSTAYGIVSGKVSQKIYERKNVGKEITPEEAQTIVEEVKQEIPKQIVQEAIKETKTQENNPLLAEAKKYKSAEEFVKAQGTSIYHGSDAMYDASKITKQGISVSKDRGIAENFMSPDNGILNELSLSKNAKILKESDIPSGLQKSYINRAKLLSNPNNFSKELQKEVIEKQQDIIEYAKKSGYDAVDIPFENEIRVINPDVIKTKSQLTDIWNEAHKNQTTKKSKITYQPTENTYGVSDSVAHHAISEGLEMRFDNLPKYDVMSKKEQSMAGADLMANDYERARRIAMGEEKAPQGILPEAVFLAVENKAIREGDTATIYDLAYNSGLKQRATEMGQAISMWTERYPNSPTKAIEEIKQAKEVVAIKKLGQKRIKEEKTQGVKAIKEETKKLNLDKERWSSFLDSLKC